MKTKRNNPVARKQKTLEAKTSQRAQPFNAHLLELRKRAMWVALTIGLGAAAAYFVQQQIVGLLLKPAGDQQFIYTTPGGGLNFLVSVCVYVGLLAAIPVIIYNLLKFIEPLLHESSTKFIMRISMFAAVFALAGVLFGYFFGLPSALKFLSHQFVTDQVKAMIAIQSYLGFVTKFLLAFAIIFQAPLIMLLINRIKPLNPQSLFKAERWVVLGSFITGAVISPTPDIRSMLLLAVPMIITYQIGIGLVWHVNRKGRRSPSLLTLLEEDAAKQAERLQKLEKAIVTPIQEFNARPLLSFPQLEPAYATAPVMDDPLPEPTPVAEPEEVIAEPPIEKLIIAAPVEAKPLAAVAAAPQPVPIAIQTEDKPEAVPTNTTSSIETHIQMAEALTVAQETTDQTEAADRTNYLHSAPAQRVRRRVIE